MLLAVDVGNTHSLFALCDAGAIRHQWRVATDAHRTEDETAVLLSALMEQEDASFGQIQAMIISSVVPDAIFALRHFARRYLDCEAVVVGEREGALPMPVKIDQPEELGADRLVNAYAAFKEHDRALIVIDFGTATTFDVVSAAGEYLGGVIAPGVNLSLEALSQAAAKLHGIRIRRPESAIGKSTTQAMQSGVYFGYLGLVSEIIAQIRAECPAADFVVATGGLAELYAKDNALIDRVEPELTIQGLMQLHEPLQKESNGF